MKYKGTLIVVKNSNRALKFYSDMFGLRLVQDNDGNMELTDNLYLQESSYWETFTRKRTIPNNNQSELYFEESDIEEFIKRLETLYPETEYVNRLMTHSWGQKVVRFYDPDGNLIEVGTPVQLRATNSGLQSSFEYFKNAFYGPSYSGWATIPPGRFEGHTSDSTRQNPGFFVQKTVPAR